MAHYSGRRGSAPLYAVSLPKGDVNAFLQLAAAVFALGLICFVPVFSDIAKSVAWPLVDLLHLHWLVEPCLRCRRYVRERFQAFDKPPPLEEDPDAVDAGLRLKRATRKQQPKPSRTGVVRRKQAIVSSIEGDGMGVPSDAVIDSDVDSDGPSPTALAATTTPAAGVSPGAMGAAAMPQPQHAERPQAQTSSAGQAKAAKKKAKASQPVQESVPVTAGQAQAPSAGPALSVTPARAAVPDQSTTSTTAHAAAAVQPPPFPPNWLTFDVYLGVVPLADLARLRIEAGLPPPPRPAKASAPASAAVSPSGHGGGEDGDMDAMELIARAEAQSLSFLARDEGYVAESGWSTAPGRGAAKARPDRGATTVAVAQSSSSTVPTPPSGGAASKASKKGKGSDQSTAGASTQSAVAAASGTAPGPRAKSSADGPSTQASAAAGSTSVPHTAALEPMLPSATPVPPRLPSVHDDDDDGGRGREVPLAGGGGSRAGKGAVAGDGEDDDELPSIAPSAQKKGKVKGKDKGKGKSQARPSDDRGTQGPAATGEVSSATRVPAGAAATSRPAVDITAPQASSSASSKPLGSPSTDLPDPEAGGRYGRISDSDDDEDDEDAVGFFGRVGRRVAVLSAAAADGNDLSAALRAWNDSSGLDSATAAAWAQDRARAGALGSAGEATDPFDGLQEQYNEDAARAVAMGLAIPDPVQWAADKKIYLDRSSLAAAGWEQAPVRGAKAKRRGSVGAADGSTAGQSAAAAAGGAVGNNEPRERQAVGSSSGTGLLASASTSASGPVSQASPGRPPTGRKGQGAAPQGAQASTAASEAKPTGKASTGPAGSTSRGDGQAARPASGHGRGQAGQPQEQASGDKSKDSEARPKGQAGSKSSGGGRRPPAGGLVQPPVLASGHGAGLKPARAVAAGGPG